MTSKKTAGPKNIANVLIENAHENKYCDKNDIKLIRLNNGIILFGIHRQVPDLARINIITTFIQGSYFDPPGKSGLHHLIEHLFDNSNLKMARDNNAEANARTSPYQLEFYLWGIAHPKVLDYGVWPALSVMADNLSHGGLSITDNQFNSEKNVIIEEIHKRYADHSYLVNRYLTDLLFKKNNPFASIYKDSIDDVKNITIDDIKLYTKNIFNAKNLIIGTFSQGDQQIRDKAFGIITEKFSTFPAIKDNAVKPDWNLYNNLNKNIASDNIYTYKTGLHNNIVSVCFIFQFRADQYSTDQYSLDYLINEINSLILYYTRERGLAYSAGAYFLNNNADNCTVIMGFDMSSQACNQDFITGQILPQIKTVIDKNLSDEKIAFLVNKMRKNKQAVPMNYETKFNYIFEGLVKYNRMLNADKIWDLYRSITAENLIFWKNKILKTKPVIAMIGDLAV